MRSTPAILFALSIAASLRPCAIAQRETTRLPAGTRISLAITRPVWSGTVKTGDPVYAQTVFPAVAAGRMAIPSGTYVEGKIDSFSKPTRKSSRASVAIHFTKLIFANGYTVLLPAAGVGSDSADQALLDIQASAANDLLLDNGAQIEMTLGKPLILEADQVAAATPLSKPPVPGSFKSATLCRPTPGSAGTAPSPDTIIPGSPGTPATVIPGAFGSPDTVIPGSPATPATVISGTPGTPDTPGIFCPASPLVLSSTAPQPVTTQTAAKRN